MFDENFSFISTTTSPFSCVSNEIDPCSTDISPFSSRCPSPISPPRTQAFPSALAIRQRDDRFNSRPSLTKLNLPRHPSIIALTGDLESQVVSCPSDHSTPPCPYADNSPPNTELEVLDPGFGEPADHRTVPSSRADSFDPSLWDLSMADLNTTSYPSDLSPPYTLRRRQRQALMRLQCLGKRAPDLAILVEECHPSSLPMVGKVRAKSISSGGRIEKERAPSVSVVKRTPRMRKRATG